MASLMILFWKRTVPLLFICVMGNVPMNSNLSLEFFLRLTRMFSPTLYWWLLRSIFSRLLLWLIRNFLRCRMCYQSETCLMFKMASWQNNRCFVDACSVARTANMVAAMMTDHGLLLTMLDTSNVRMIFPIFWWNLSMIALDWWVTICYRFPF